MARSKTLLLGGLIVTTAALLLAAIYVRQSHARLAAREASEEVLGSLRRLERMSEIERLRFAAFRGSVEQGQEHIVSLLRTLLDSTRKLSEALVDSRSSSDEVEFRAEEVDGVEETSQRDDSELPPLPESVHAPGVIRRLELANLKSLLDDPVFNPEGRVLTRVEKTQLAALVAEAKGKIETLDRQVTALAARGMENLRARGDYVDYAKGESYHSERGVYTAAEQTENQGTRMFYLFPDEFPAIYEKRREKHAVAEDAVRKILSVFRSERAN